MSRELLIRYSNKHKDILYKFINEHIDPKSHFKILDIGCRRGDDLKRLADAYKNLSVYGVDIDLASLKDAKLSLHSNSTNNVFLARGESLPFRGGVFDLVISSEVIEHTPNVEKFIQEAHRVLKKQGFFIVTTPSKYTYSRLFGYLVPAPFKKRIRKCLYYLNPGNDKNPHFREYSSREMKVLFQKNGFRVERIEGGILRVPIWALFEKASFLIYLWRGIDWIIGKTPFGLYLKHNFIMLSQKSGVDEKNSCN